MTSKDSSQEEVSALVQAKMRDIEVAQGRRKADLVLKNTTYVNVFSRELCCGDIAISCGRIVGIGSYQGEQEVDYSGRVVIPGLIDPHIQPFSNSNHCILSGRAVIICNLV